MDRFFSFVDPTFSYSSMARMEILQKAANVLVYIYLLTTTGYSVFAKDRIADIFHGYQT